MAVLSIHHVSMVVADTRKALIFYCEVLGLSESHDRPDLSFAGAWLQIGSQQIHLLEVDNPDPVKARPQHGGRDRHLAVSVDNLTDIEARLVSHNIFFTRSRSGRAAIFCRDPDGNGIELIKTKA